MVAAAPESLAQRSLPNERREIRFTSMSDPVSNLPPDPVIEAYKRGIDRTLIQENLRKSPDERIRTLQEFARFAEELRRAGEKLRARR